MSFRAAIVLRPRHSTLAQLIANQTRPGASYRAGPRHPMALPNYQYTVMTVEREGGGGGGKGAK